MNEESADVTSAAKDLDPKAARFRSHRRKHLTHGRSDRFIRAIFRVESRNDC